MSLISTEAKEKNYFQINKIFRSFFILRLECELCVYGQEGSNLR